MSSATGPALRRVASHGAPPADNMLIHGDNLEAMRALRRTHEAQVRLAYLDPPFNSGRAFAEYDDRLSPSSWRNFMHERLLALAPLMRPDGSVFVEIDDTELGTLIELMDEVFGRKNRMSIISVVRSASTGHKAINPGPVNVTDFVLVYAVDRKQSPLYPLQRVRKTFDHAYSTFLENPKAPFGEWRFCPLRAQVAQVLGHDGTRAARKALGGEAFDQEVVRFALRNPSHVVRFAQPRYDAVGKRVQALIDASRKRKDQVLCLRRDKLPDFFVRNGNRILFLADKVISTADGPGLSEPLTNVWDDLPFQGIAKEGGVKFERNKKPERLLERVLNLGSAPGDLVLDPFVGSGTTAAVALKMGRSFIGVDAGDHLLSLAVPRLRAVLDGSDQSGIPGNPGERKRGFRVLEVR